MQCQLRHSGLAGNDADAGRNPRSLPEREAAASALESFRRSTRRACDRPWLAIWSRTSCRARLTPSMLAAEVVKRSIAAWRLGASTPNGTYVFRWTPKCCAWVSEPGCLKETVDA